MPDFSSQTKNYIQTIIRNLKSTELINFIISEPSHDDWGLIVINKITYIAKKIVEFQPRNIFRFRNEACSTKINYQYQSKFETLNRLQIFIQMLYIMQINNKHINQAEKIHFEDSELNISAPEIFKHSIVNLTPSQVTFPIQQDSQQPKLNASHNQTQTSFTNTFKTKQEINNKSNLRDLYESQFNQYHSNYFNQVNNNSSDSEANVSELDLTEDQHEGGERESEIQTISIKESPKHQQDFNRIPILKFFLLNTNIQQDSQSINIINNNTNRPQPTMIDKNEVEIHAYAEFKKNKMDTSVDKFINAAGKGTKLDSKIYYEMMKNREQIISIRIQSASSAMSDLINYYFQTIENLLD